MKGLESYIKAGLKLVPVREGTKRPAIKNFLDEASCEPEQLKKWAALFPGCNWGLPLKPNGLVAVDVDRKHGGLEAWDALIEANDPFETRSATTGSGGRHFVFKQKAGAKYRGKIKPGIDIRHAHIIVVSPSVHPDTGLPYIWDNPETPIRDVPEWLAKYIEKSDLKGRSNPAYKFGEDYLSRLVSELKKHELDYHEWVQAGMAIHASDSGDTGLELFIDLSRGESYVEGDEEKAIEKWESFKRTGEDDAITALTLGYLVRKKGGVVPNPHYESDKEAFKAAKVNSYEEWASEIEDFIVDETDEERFICPNKRAIVKHFNRKGYAYLGEGEHKAPIIKFSDRGTGVLQMKPMTSRGMLESTAEYCYTYLKVMATDVKKVIEPAAKVWLESKHKRRFIDPVFRPDAVLKGASIPKGSVNLFTGFPVKGIATVDSELEAFLIMIRDSLCGGDEIAYEWLLDWIAHIIQYPEEKPSTVPVIIGDQGTGKGLLFDHVLRRILGATFKSVKTSSNLTAQFNLDMSNKLLTLIDEASWRGNKTEDGILKNLIGSEKLEVEIKYGPKYEIENFSRYVIASNNPEAVAVERSNRRYFVIECSADFAGRTDYFEPLWNAYRRGNLCQKFLGYLEERAIDFFDPYDIPQNMRGSAAKIATEGPVAMFWNDVLCEPDSTVTKDLWRNGELLTKKTVSEFREYAKAIQAYQKGITDAAFWSQSRKLIPTLPKSSRARDGEALHYVKRIDPIETVESFTRTLKLPLPEIFEPYWFEEADDFGIK